MEGPHFRRRMALHHLLRCDRVDPIQEQQGVGQRLRQALARSRALTPRQALATTIVRGLRCPAGVKLARNKLETPVRKASQQNTISKNKNPKQNNKTPHEFILKFIVLEEAWAAKLPAVTWRRRRLVLGRPGCRTLAQTPPNVLPFLSGSSQYPLQTEAAPKTEDQPSPGGEARPSNRHLGCERNPNCQM